MSAADAPPFRDARELVVTAGGPVDVIIETGTVEHGRDGRPSQAIVVARTASGERTATTTAPGDVDRAAAFSLACLPRGLISHVGRPAVLTASGDGVTITISPADPFQEQP